MTGRTLFGVAALTLAVAACQEQTPTALDGTLVPTTPTTVEIEFDFNEFATGLELYGGYGNNNAFGFGGVLSYVAHDFEAAGLDARTLVRFGGPPVAAVVQDTTGASVTDSTLTVLGGSVLVLVDTLQSVFGANTMLEAATLGTRWSSSTASWTNAVDSLGDVAAWDIPGAGEAETFATVAWVPGETFDTIRFDVDSATVARWTDTTDATRGLRLSSPTPGTRLAFRGVALSVTARPASNPDTLVTLAVTLHDQTFIYDPPPTPDAESVWVGGAPAWRSVFRVSLPDVLNGPAELCAAVPCPVRIAPEFVTAATLLLNTATSPASFQPTDSIQLISLPVLAPDRLPKSPLGDPFAPGVDLPPQYFGSASGTEVSVPITTFVKGLFDEPGEGEPPAPTTLALLALSEPSSLGVAAFAGPSSATPPRLRLVLTIPEFVGLR